MKFLPFNRMLHYYYLPNIRNCLVRTSYRKMERWEKGAFQLAKMQETNIRLNLKIVWVTDISLSVDSLNVIVYTSH